MTKPSLIEIMARRITGINVHAMNEMAKSNVIFDCEKYLNALCTAIGCSIDTLEMIRDGRAVVVPTNKDVQSDEHFEAIAVLYSSIKNMRVRHEYYVSEIQLNTPIPPEVESGKE